MYFVLIIFLILAYLVHIDIMLVDLGRNDVNRVCVPQSVTVDSLMAIEKYVCPYFT